jgi:hypothetical protein
VKDCTRCNGTKVASYDATKTCIWCKGTGTFEAPNLDAIRAILKGRKGLVSRKPEDKRAAYVWRMARFHGGKDTTLPMMAPLDINGDPFIDQLDTLADETAKLYFGSDLAGAHRWYRALHG